jgi:hypothetical protein
LKIGLAEFFIDVIDEKVINPVDLHFSCSPMYYLTGDEQKAYELGDVIPLWVSYSGDINFAYDIQKNDYFLFYLDDGKVERRYSWSLLLKQTVESVMEYEFDSDNDQADAVNKVKFIFSCLKPNNLDELIKEILQDWNNHL